MIAPCQNCPNRELHCHSTCQKYKDFRQYKQEIEERKMKDIQTRMYFSELGEKKRIKRAKGR